MADDAAAWTAAGFTVQGDRVRIGTVSFHLVGSEEGSAGITAWRLAGLSVPGASVDGLPTEVVAEPDHDDDGPAGPAHPNGVIGLDHVVVATPDLERSIEAFTAIGLELRRVRDLGETGTGLRQAFFRLGTTVLEVVGGPTGSGATATEAPATWFGIAVDVADLDASAAFLGEGLGRVKAAVQPGRRIATLRHAAFGMTLVVAAMDHDPRH
ncbi:hypothetical protein BH10ACT1_BH10ACT1_21770 [soil metagenome]